MKSKILILLLFLTISYSGFSQWDPNAKPSEPVYFDAIVFKSDTAGLGRVDAFTLVPYETIHFVETAKGYGAKYDLIVVVYDTLSRVVAKKELQRKLFAEEYFVTEGGNAQFDYTQVIFNLKPGQYKIKALVIDKFNNNEFDRARSVNVLDFSQYDFAVSGLMLVSSIEEDDGRYIITPHISDNIADLEDGFFAFFEAYNTKDIDRVALQYEVVDGDGKIVKMGQKAIRKITKGTNQLYLNVNDIGALATGSYTLRILAYNVDSSAASSNVIAITQRTIKSRRNVFSFVLEDIDKAIRQLRYVAYSDDIDFIEEGETEQQKRDRFIQFWEKKDPTPGTKRNEAFQEYYSRIYYADQKFDSYSSGWMSDMGMVYVVFGPPFQVEQSNDYYGTKRYEVWYYQDNRTFTFMDNTGFGDFRLVRPMTVTEKYEYER